MERFENNTCLRVLKKGVICLVLVGIVVAGGAASASNLPPEATCERTSSAGFVQSGPVCNLRSPRNSANIGGRVEWNHSAARIRSVASSNTSLYETRAGAQNTGEMAWAAWRTFPLVSVMEIEPRNIRYHAVTRGQIRNRIFSN